MPLSKRDTFVRYLDPMRCWWEDANGDVHFSSVNACKAFELEPTEENRAAVIKIVCQAQGDFGMETLYRAAPDSDDYWIQVHPDDRPPEFKDLPYVKPPNA